jgi:hypothetical protein
MLKDEFKKKKSQLKKKIESIELAHQTEVNSD